MNTHAARSWIVILIASIATSSAYVLLEEPTDPDAECCDHLFYRAQSVAWLGLDEPEALTIPAGNRLEQVYDEYYYDRANGLTSQPPYVYRVGVPALAGVVGRFTNIDRAYRILHLGILFLIAFLSGYSVLFLTDGALVPAVTAVGAVLAVPQMARSFADNYMTVDPASVMILTLVLLLTVRSKFLAASLVSALIAPLIKETLIPLAFSVALAAWLSQQPRRIYWGLAVMPLVIQAVLRIAVPVADRPMFSELFVLNDPYFGLFGFVTAFAPVVFLLLGMSCREMRLWSAAFLPLAVGLWVITTSAIADSARIWLTFWPVLLILGLAGLWRLARPIWLKYSWAALLITSAGVATLSQVKPEVVPLRWLAMLLPMVACGFLMLHSVYWAADSGQQRSGSPTPSRRGALVD
ncbi:MAG: hypothetical protein M8860_01915 [marine benthic group bacterium]|nr:hypothetical protein [Candidatus Carthagonibacter metallireducens]